MGNAWEWVRSAAPPEEIVVLQRAHGPAPPAVGSAGLPGCYRRAGVMLGTCFSMVKSMSLFQAAWAATWAL